MAIAGISTSEHPTPIVPEGDLPEAGRQESTAISLIIYVTKALCVVVALFLGSMAVLTRSILQYLDADEFAQRVFIVFACMGVLLLAAGLLPQSVPVWIAGFVYVPAALFYGLAALLGFRTNEFSSMAIVPGIISALLAGGLIVAFERTRRFHR